MLKREEILWNNVMIMVGLDAGAVVGLYNLLYMAQYKTIVWFVSVNIMSMIGITAGTHRLFCHNSYRAGTPLRVLLMIWHTMAVQESVFSWCRDHRNHHKYSDNEGDPYNASRGFFFSHMGWLMVRKNDAVREKGKDIYVDDLLNDPVVAFNRKHFQSLSLSILFIIPTLVPYFLWEESLWVAFIINIFRYVEVLHRIFSVNSFAHFFGMRPYNPSIKPTESMMVAYMTMGEGYHNFHHVYPYDYSTSEFGWAINFNLATAFIDLAHRLNLAWDKKKVIEKRTEISEQKLQTLKEHGNISYQYLLGFSQYSWYL